MNRRHIVVTVWALDEAVYMDTYFSDNHLHRMESGPKFISGQLIVKGLIEIL